MNILMNCLSSVSGGATTYLRNLVPLLSRRFLETQGGHSLTFLYHEGQRDLFSAVPAHQCFALGGKRSTGWQRVLWERRNIGAIIAKTKADVLFTPYQIAPLASEARQVLMLRNMEPFLFRNYPYALKTSLRNTMLARASARALKAADRIIAVSEFARDHLVERLDVGRDRIRTIYHGRTDAIGEKSDAARDKAALIQLELEDRFVLTAGSLLPYRRTEDVVAAFDRCAEDLPNGTQLAIAGSGTDRRYGDLVRRTIASSPNRDRIHQLGQVDQDSMQALYRQCDACVIATEIEACPNIAIEAMTAGCVIIASDRPPLPEMFAGESLTYRARDLDDLEQQMRRGLRDNGLRERMKAGARARAAFFSWNRCADETYAALTDWP